MSYIVADPSFKSNSMRPLDKDMLVRLYNSVLCVDDAIPDLISFLSELHSVKIINQRHQDYILSGQTPGEQADRLIEVITRRSVADYNKFISCLQSRQPILAEILRGQAGNQ